MKVGSAVLYVTAPGRVGYARVTAVLEAGPSGNKTLDLVTPSGRKASAVPHVVDCAVSAGYWCLEASEVKPVDAPKVRRRITEARSRKPKEPEA
jgi:hypothetical protein